MLPDGREDVRALLEHLAAVRVEALHLEGGSLLLEPDGLLQVSLLASLLPHDGEVGGISNNCRLEPRWPQRLVQELDHIDIRIILASQKPDILPLAPPTGQALCVLIACLHKQRYDSTTAKFNSQNEKVF